MAAVAIVAAAAAAIVVVVVEEEEQALLLLPLLLRVLFQGRLCFRHRRPLVLYLLSTRPWHHSLIPSPPPPLLSYSTHAGSCPCEQYSSFSGAPYSR